MAAGQDEGLTSASIDGALYLFTEEKRGTGRPAKRCSAHSTLTWHSFERTVLGVTPVDRCAQHGRR
jgi:hypothetical protein